MGGALPPYDGRDSHVVADKTFHNPMFKNRDHSEMKGARLPPRDGDGGDTAVDETIHNPMCKDEEHGAMDYPPPPHRRDNGNGDEDGDGDGDVVKTSRSRTIRARVALAIGLGFEACATWWAFQQAVSAGALEGDVECGYGSRLPKLYGSYLVEDRCDGPIDADDFFRYNADLYEDVSWSQWEGYVGCDSLTDTVAGVHSFQKLCSCTTYSEFYDAEPCSWVALSDPSDGICFAQGVATNSSDGTMTGNLYTSFFSESCWATNPTGTAALTITALVIALSSQLLEAVVGFKFWKDTDKRTGAFTLAASIFEAVGVVAVTAVLLSLPGFFGVSKDTNKRIPIFFGLAWATVPIVVVGALAEIAAEHSDRVARQLPYLGAVGSGLIWLGAALLEVVVTSYLLWTGAGIQDAKAIAREAGGLFALELLALVSMWLAHGLWARAKILRASAKGLEGSLRNRTFSRRLK